MHWNSQMLLANLWDPCNSFFLTKTLMNLQRYLLGPLRSRKFFSILYNRSQKHQESRHASHLHNLPSPSPRTALPSMFVRAIAGNGGVTSRQRTRVPVGEKKL